MARYLSCACKAFSDVEFWPIELFGVEAYTSPGDFKILALSSTPNLILADWIGKDLTFSITPQGQSTRYFNGCIVKMQLIAGDLHGYSQYLFTVSAWPELLNYSNHFRTFYQQDINQIITTVLAPYAASCSGATLNYSAEDYSAYYTLTPELIYQQNVFTLPANVTMPKYVVQYNESDLNFITRLLATLGIYYWVDWSQTDKTMYLGGGSGQNYIRATDPFIWPEDQPSSDSQVLLDASVGYQITAANVAQANYNPETAAKNRLQQQQVQTVAKSNAALQAAKYNYPGITPIKSQAELEQQSQVVVNLRSVVAQVGLGQMLRISGNMPKSLQAIPTVIPTEIVHYAQDYDGLPHTIADIDFHILPETWPLLRTHYENKITAVQNNNVPYHPAVKFVQPSMPGYQTAFVVGPTNGDIYTDKLGRVKIWFPWDENNSQAKIDKCPWVRVMQQHAGSGFGHQFLPHVGDEVSVMFVSDDPNKPIVAGSNYNAVTKLPFDITKNNTVSGIKTVKHAFYVTDQQDDEQVMLYSAKDLQQVVGGDLTRNISGMDHLLVGGDALEEVLAGNYNISANKSIKLQSGASCVTITADSIDISGPEVNFITQGGGPANPIAVKGKYHSCPQQYHVGGAITSGSSDVFVGGVSVARVGDSAECEIGTDTLQQGHVNFFVNGKQVVCVNHATAHGGQVKEGVAQTSAGHDPNLIPKTAEQVDRYAIKVGFHMQNDDSTRVLYHQFNLTKDDPEGGTKNYVIDSKDSATIAEGVTGGKVICSLLPHGRQLDIIALNNNPQIPYYKTNLTAPSAPVVNNNFDTNHIFNCEVLWPMVISDIRQEDRTENAAANTETKEQQAQVANYCKISPFDIDYFKKNGNNVTVFIHGYNVPLGEFAPEVAGFENVTADSGDIEAIDPLGAQAEMSQRAPDDYIRPIPAGCPSTIYRDKDVLHQQTNYMLPDDYVKTTDDGLSYIAVSTDDAPDGIFNLNGTGSRNWAIHMEYNLNKATKKFDEKNSKDYQKYTRLVHVTWTGNPASALDFMVAVDDAFDKKAVGDLVALLKQLKDSGLQVNVIAHSLGNALLLKALDTMGKNGEKVDHAFLWEAAVPNDVFSRPAPKVAGSDPWQMPDLIKGADKFTVLYSENDNILGPIPIPAKQVKGVNQVDVDKSKPFTELLPAYLTTKLGLESIYHFAMWAGLPLSDLWNYAELQKAYKFLLSTVDKKYLAPTDLTADQKSSQVTKSTACLLPSFAEQIKYDKQANYAEYEKLLHTLQQELPEMRQAFIAAGWGVKSKFQQMKYSALSDIVVPIIRNPETWLIILESVVVGVEDAICSSSVVGDVAVAEINSWARQKADEIYSTNKPIFDGALCLMHVMKKCKVQSVPALGYLGPDQKSLNNGAFLKKYHAVDQSKWLWSHSGMHVPSKDVMENVYIKEILNPSKGISKFGNYS
jgi:type VI secretion system VgrG family protein